MNGCDPERLISLYLLDRTSMTPEQVAQLSEWISEDLSHARHYLASVQFHSMIRDYFGGNDDARKAVLETGSRDMDPAMLERDLRQLLLMEKSSPSLQVGRPCLEQADRPPERPNDRPARRTVSRFWLSVSVTSMAAILLLAIWVLVVPPRPVAVATLRDSLDAQWLGSDAHYSKGHRLLGDGQPVRLAKGFSQWSFDNGAELLVEGPSEIRVCGIDRIALSYGKVCTRVPESARGFRVDAPHYGVVDLGTEFGMEVGVDGTANVLMVKGKASLVSQEIQQSDTRVLLAEGQARRIRMDGRIETAEIEPDRFVRAFNSQSGLLWRGEPLDLADVVGGGNGFGTGQLRWGVQIFLGLMVPVTFGPARPGPSGYVRARGSAFIDGVFVPSGNGSPIQVSSKRHLWNGCPKTSAEVPMGPCNGGPVGGREDQLVLNGSQYGVPRHPALSLYSNVGITFDLRAIRRFCRELHKDLTLSRFTTVAGLSDDVLTQWPGQADRPPVADLWVLIDGENRLKKTELASGADPVQIDVQLEPDAEFLTVVVTEGTDHTSSFDRVILGDPIIELSRN